MKIRTLLALGAGLAAALSAHAQEPVKPVAGGQVKFENDKMRVLEYRAEAGGAVCGFGKHSHPAHLTIILSDAKVKITTADGKEIVAQAKAGDMFWSPAEVHEVEDVSGQGAHCYLVEIKDQDWKPSTGLTR